MAASSQQRQQDDFADDEPGFNRDAQASHHLLLGTIETLLNAFIELDDDSFRRARALDGLVVRVKILDPYKVFYLQFTHEGIEVSDQPAGIVKVRVGGRLSDIVSYVLGITAPDNTRRIRLWGESESIGVLRDLLREFNLRTAVQRWLQDHLDIEGLWGKISRHDQSWLTDLLPMPNMMRDTLSELRTLNKHLQRQETELAEMRSQFSRQRRTDLVFILLAMIAVVMALRGFDDLAAITPDRVALLVAGVVLVGNRLLRTT